MLPLLAIQSILFIRISFSLPVLSDNVTASSSICPVPLSPLLQHLSTHIHQYPTCSLSSRPADPAPEFLSFEEWKAKQLADQDASNREKESYATPNAQPASTQNANTSNELTRKSRRRNATGQDAHLGENIIPSSSEKQREVASPRSHIPLIDRFNYASNECNARIHSSHKTAKSASSILSRKKDRYMLSPCQTSKESQFVIVELCEDIRIDTIQLANFEFFSGVFKDFRVSVAHAYTSDGKGWVVVGDYTAKNIRGVQSFHPSKELLPFYRYIRIDFLSYYGNEYFCPVSLLRVYGLTQMEEWKSDVWKAEWEATRTTAEQMALPDPTVILLEGRPVRSASDNSAPAINTTDVWSAVVAGDSLSAVVEDNQASKSAESQAPEPTVLSTTVPGISLPGVTSPPPNDSHWNAREAPTARITTAPVADHPNVFPEPSSRSDDVAEEGVPAVEAEFIRSPQSTELDQTPSVPVDSQTQITFLKIPTATITSALASSPLVSSLPHATGGVASDTPQQHTITQIVSTTIILSAVTPSSSPPVPNGESVYRMIINRLATLEGNQTLYARYVEEQGRMVNVRLERMEEDIGRLGGIVTLQQQHVARMLETYQAEMESEHGKLISQVEHLANEVLMEKRLGVAQLLLLVTVLVFMGLTRGSRGEPIRLSRASAAWNRGIQSSGEWVSGWRGVRISGPNLDDAPAVGLHKSTSSPTLQLRPPFVQPSLSGGLGSIERRPRRTSSQHARPHETNYDELFRSSTRLSRNPTRSRRSSQHSRSRNHTPTRPQLQLPGSSDLSQDQGAFGLGISTPLGIVNTNVTGAGPMYQKGHKRTNSGGAVGYWRAGRSVSLSSAKGLGVGSAAGKSVGPTRRLAKTAHMHEVKPIRAGSSSTESSTLPEKRRTMAEELDASLSLSVLSPMMEDPHSAGMVGFGDAAPRGYGPVRIGGFDAEISTAQSEGVLSDPFGSGIVAASSSGLDASSGGASAIGIPFPSPALDGEEEEEDVWVDDGGDDESFLVQASALGLGMPSSSPTKAKRGSGFSFGSPRRTFAFASSPPGKPRLKRRSSDAGADAGRLDGRYGEGTTSTGSSTRVG